MTIRYQGRMLPCFLSREGCKEKAVYRVESRYYILHVCEEHRDRLEGKKINLAPEGEVDVIEATSMDNESLRGLPHIVQVDEQTGGKEGSNGD